MGINVCVLGVRRENGELYGLRGDSGGDDDVVELVLFFFWLFCLFIAVGVFLP